MDNAKGQGGGGPHFSICEGEGPKTTHVHSVPLMDSNAVLMTVRLFLADGAQKRASSFTLQDDLGLSELDYSAGYSIIFL